MWAMNSDKKLEFWMVLRWDLEKAVVLGYLTHKLVVPLDDELVVLKGCWTVKVSELLHYSSERLSVTCSELSRVSRME
jgi:hypothetical protein